MRTILAYPGNSCHAQNAALALLEAGALQTFLTSFRFDRNGALASMLRRAPFGFGEAIVRQLGRRAFDLLPGEKITTLPAWEILRTAAQVARVSPPVVDRIWDQMARRFDAEAARRFVPRTRAIVAFEYIALASFRRAQQEGVARILHLPSLDSRHFDELRRREVARWRELATPYDAYFESKFEERYERCCAERDLADVMIANSSLTAWSHVERGADPTRVFVAPLGGPEPIARVETARYDERRPLRVMFAGQFSIGKGAYYLISAWRKLAAGDRAELVVYGRRALPAPLLASLSDDVQLQGAVTRDVLFAAYERADVLVFPTLSDGFGMVVAEALAHGLPVITTDQAGAADLIGPDNGRIIPAADADALCEALQWCLDNRRRLVEMRFHALETARRNRWTAYRRRLIANVDLGLRNRGYSPTFDRPDSTGEFPPRPLVRS
ncbi:MULTISPECIES: glycosyltransferase [Methylosinus]|nr:MULTISPECIES: glycosyltransferase [Methylosinus]